MPFRLHPSINATATAASVLMLAGATLIPQQAIAAPQAHDAALPAATPDTSTLKHLPAGRDELIFRGENTSRRWSVYLSRSEADRASAMQLALLNAVSVLPDRSSLKLIVNGRILSVMPVRSPDRISTMKIKIPAGVLVPGPNRIEIVVGLSHRVDCSLKATYELWAMLDPAQTGIVTDGTALSSIHSLQDVAAEPLAEDGTTRIHVRMADTTNPDAVAQAARFVDALVRRAGLPRPVVDVGPALGRGAGFDVVLSTGFAADDAVRAPRLLGRDENVSLTRDPATSRLILTLAGSDAADLDQAIAAIDKATPKTDVLRPSGGAIAIDAEMRKSFAELGFATEGFAGRHYMASADLTLPADFYPANNDKARLLIDGSHSAALDQDGELIVRVNGSIVSSKRLAAGSAEQFQRDLVELPLRFFHAGHNELSIEGITSSPQDQRCDVVSMPRDTRLSIAGTSELEFPQFARLGTLPQIPAALASSALPAGQLHMYLLDAEPGALGTALTILANIASTSGFAPTPVLHMMAPQHDDVPGVVIGPIDQMPDMLSTTLHRLGTPTMPTLDVAARNDVAATDPAANGLNPLDDAATGNARRLKAGWNSLIANGEGFLRQRGFFFSGTDAQASSLPLSARSVLIGAVAPERAKPNVGGLELPQFTRDPAQWLVVTAKSEDLYEAGIERLVVNGQWSALSGQAVSLDLDSNTLRSAQPSQVTYVVPSTFVLSDVRPILGGIVSNNILLSLAALMLLMAILGTSTHALIKRSGAK